MKKEQQSEQKITILKKLLIVKNATEAAAHKVSKEKLETAAKWLVEIHEETKDLIKYCEKELK